MKKSYATTFEMVEDKVSRLAAIVYGLLTDKKYAGNWLTAGDIARHLKTGQRAVEDAIIGLLRLGLVKVNQHKGEVAA